MNADVPTTGRNKCVIFTAPSGVAASDAVLKLKAHAKSKHEHEIKDVKIEASIVPRHLAYVKELAEEAQSKDPKLLQFARMESALMRSPAAIQHVLAKPRDYLRRIWREAAREQLQSVPLDTDVFVLLHSAYYHADSEDFISCVDMSVLSDWIEDTQRELVAIVTLVDDVDEMVERLSRPGQIWQHKPIAMRPNETPEQWEARDRAVRIREVFDRLVISLNWRRVETLMAADLFEELHAHKHFVLATKHHLKSVYELLFPSDSATTKVAYLSHPITQARIMLRRSSGADHKEAQQEIGIARTLINEVAGVASCLISPPAEIAEQARSIIPLLPTTIDELRFVDRVLDIRWDFPDDDELLYTKPGPGGQSASDLMESFTNKEWNQLRPLLDNLAEQIRMQVNSRDRRMVEQAGAFASGALLVWRPYFAGGFAGGVKAEIQHRNNLVRFGVLQPQQVRCLVMSPYSDLIEFRLQTLLAGLEKSLKVPGTNNPPACIADFKRTPPPDLRTALRSNQLDGERLRALIDPGNAYQLLVEDEAPVSALAGDRGRLYGESQQLGWQDLADIALSKDDLAELLAEGDEIYPHNDTSPDNFTAWALKQLEVPGQVPG